jgi:hypothetical protein
MDNQETLTTLDTQLQDTGRKQTKHKNTTQHRIQTEKKHDDASCSRRVGSQRRNMMTPVAPEG